MDNVKDTETVTSMIFTTVTIEPSTITITQTPSILNKAHKCYVYRQQSLIHRHIQLRLQKIPLHPRSTTKAISTLAYDTETLSSRIYQPNVYKNITRN